MYIPSTRKIISSYNVVFDENNSSTLAYTSQPYVEVMVISPSVLYTNYATYSKEQTSDIITITQFGGRDLSSESHDNAESGDKSDENSVMAPLLSKEKMDMMYYGNESEDENMTTEMLPTRRSSDLLCRCVYPSELPLAKVS